MENDFFQVVTLLIGAGAIYGGIRSDLRAMHERFGRLEKSVDKAHSRLDEISLGGRRHGD